MKFLKLFSIIAILGIFTGCASIPSPAEMEADIEGFVLPQLPEDGNAIVYVVRPSSLGGLVRFKVFIDDKEVESEMGFTRGKQYVYFNLTPGEHQILSQAENTASVAVTASAGDIIFIQQDAQMGVLFARNSASTIPELEGKYYVKNLSLGTVNKVDR
ncbi:DUF2846 domain-containing protein [Gammaproteobacteria bacterium]|nr:DUF2846 domain-containing protein [Gammaproteobacteria bacterium]